MHIRSLILTMVGGATAAAVGLHAGEAEACGGCFHEVLATESTVVSGHRMAVSVSPTQAVLWDQITFTGSADEFSWVLPIRGDARVQVASDAFFEVLEAGSFTSVRQPPEGCAVPTFGGGSDDGFGCGSDDFEAADSSDDSFTTADSGANDSGVEVLHRETVGPYETVTLSTEQPDALPRWLADNGFAVTDDVAPILADYAEEGFDFIALKLRPSANTSEMTPIRVVTPGSGYTLPLRMVKAGTGANVDLVLYVIGEGRYQVGGSFQNAVIPPNLVTWDFIEDRSDYAELRVAAMGQADGATWLTSYARRDPFFSEVFDLQGQVTYQTDAGTFSNLAEAYLGQGQAIGQMNGSFDACDRSLSRLAGSMDVVTDLCDENGENCRSPEPGEIDRRALACGGLDDVAVALTGLHPADVFVSRLEARLPRELLSEDLIVQAADEQVEVNHRFSAGLRKNACWDQQPAAGIAAHQAGSSPLPRGGLVGFSLAALGLILVTRRARLA
ncbi:MAG: DUF2330 domain-containing protein [Myxococcota bacterium]